MDGIDAALLGIVQGLTEFLPVSSSGHLEIGKALLGDNSVPEESLLFTVVVHFATALSTIIVFRKDILFLLKGLFKFRWNEEFHFALKIIVSMIPAVFVGLFFENEIEELFGGNLLLVGSMLLLTALLLLLADRAKNTGRPVRFLDAFVIGISQAVAILPGISRSGATISTSVLLGNDKGKAARFSFLMVVPLIFGKIAKDILSGDLSGESTDMGLLGIGFITAFTAGIFACTWMIKLVKRSKLSYFALYCTIIGLIAIAYTLST
ncbi:undecaprenyl-diphosphate phosphatase [Aegicerativicinus sediminis]|uniref:undecaprenyl-diphosphate phosphatase n=1 Tax=Aegicerativicinus sediminis TaxID=2893202 RepID=UPI001E3E61F5|nr:undecaprenyl-diphosphate phosphatase [Aegicerativicinus sediminis]